VIGGKPFGNSTGVEKFIIGTFIKSRENREKIGTEKTIGSFFIRK
jgi:hypothetical protein